MGESQTSTAPNRIPENAAENATRGSSSSTRPSSLAEREESLRRAAVVLSSLPASTASRLLDKVDGYSRHIVTQAITTLHTVAPAERKDILESFKTGMSRPSPARNSATINATASLTQVADGIQDEFVSTQSDQSNVIPANDAHRYGESIAAFFPAKKSAPHTTASQPPFHFLQSVSIEEMVLLLSGEHPQTIALVLSSIPPKTAADVLPQLSGNIQKQTLSRIGRLDDVPEATLAEVARHLQSRYQETIGSATESSGKRALQAIMAEMPQCPPKQCPPEQRQPEQCQPSTGPAESVPSPTQSVTTEPLASEVAELKIAEGTRPLAPPIATTNPIPSQSSSVDQANDSDSSDDDLVDATHAHLIALPPKVLVSALGRVSTRDALLTLCGLPNDAAEAAIGCLSRSKARGVRRGIETLGPLQLREIDEAKQAVAMVSIGAGKLDVSSNYSRAA